MKKAMRSLWVALATISFVVLPARGQNNITAGDVANMATPVTIVKLMDPHPNLPNQLLPQGINNLGEIVGHIGDERDGTGFIRSKSGQYTEFMFPGECDGITFPCTYPQGINDRGQIVGFAVLINGGTGFLREKDGSTRSLPPAPGGSVATPNSINNQGEIVGSYSSFRVFGTHGFLLRGGNYTTIDFPGTEFTVCTGINNHGLVTGIYLEHNGGVHGFLWTRGHFIATFQVVDSSGATDTRPAGINDQGQVSGNFRGEGIGGAFVRNPDGTLKIIDLAALLQPIGGSGGVLTGINNRGDLVGLFGSRQSFDIFGFLIPHGAESAR
jgi:uncharacterized membrane protein